MKQLHRTIPELSKGKPQIVAPNVAEAATSDNIEAWYSDVSDKIDPSQYEPELIFNMDETMIKSTSNKSKVYFLKDNKPLRIETNLEDGMHVTLALCISAAGRFLRPMAILEVASLPLNCNDLIYDFHFAYQSSGWMSLNLFEKWTRQVFIPAVKGIRIECNLQDKPALLFVDGHSSRHNATLMEYLVTENIHCVLLPPHTSHILQPLD